MKAHLEYRSVEAILELESWEPGAMESTWC